MCVCVCVCVCVMYFFSLDYIVDRFGLQRFNIYI